MTLREVGSALERLGTATLTQLAAEIGQPPREVEVLLEFWERRGNARRCDLQATTACGTACRACPVGSARTGATAAPARPPAGGATTVYEWVRRERRADRGRSRPLG